MYLSVNNFIFYYIKLFDYYLLMLHIAGLLNTILTYIGLHHLRLQNKI